MVRLARARSRCSVANGRLDVDEDGRPNVAACVLESSHDGLYIVVAVLDLQHILPDRQLATKSSATCSYTNRNIYIIISRIH